MRELKTTKRLGETETSSLDRYFKEPSTDFAITPQLRLDEPFRLSPQPAPSKHNNKKTYTRKKNGKKTHRKK